MPPIIKLRRKCKHCGYQHYFKTEQLTKTEHVLRKKRNYWRMTHMFACVKCYCTFTVVANIPFEVSRYQWDGFENKVVKMSPRQRAMRSMRRTAFGWTRR